MRKFLMTLLLLPYLAIGLWNGIVVGFDRHETGFVLGLLNNMPPNTIDGTARPGPMNTVMVSGRLEADQPPANTSRSTRLRNCVGLVEDIPEIWEKPVVHAGRNLRIGDWSIDERYLQNPNIPQDVRTYPYSDYNDPCPPKGCTLISRCILPETVTIIGDSGKTTDGQPRIVLPDQPYLAYPFLLKGALTPSTFAPLFVEGMMNRGELLLERTGPQALLGFALFVLAVLPKTRSNPFPVPLLSLFCLGMLVGLPFIPYGLYQILPNADAFISGIVAYIVLFIMVIGLPGRLAKAISTADALAGDPAYQASLRKIVGFLGQSPASRRPPDSRTSTHPPKPDLPSSTFWIDKKR